jgi:hypothetical protein
MLKTMRHAAAAVTMALLAVTGLRALGAADVVPTQPMGAHMEITLHASPAPGDARRAEAIVDAARRLMAQYPTTADAERAGFSKFLPRVPLPIEHYTNRANAAAAAFGRFDPMQPTSLIFERSSGGLRIVGVMYTAPNSATQAQLDAKVPLSIAAWHRHVNFCVPPHGTPRSETVGPSARFFFGSIATADACREAGGWFVPQVFGWMVHVWPMETDPAKVWAVDRGDGMASQGSLMGGMTAH